MTSPKRSALAAVAIVLGGCGGGGKDATTTAPTATPVQLNIVLHRIAPASPDGRQPAGHRGAGHRAEVEGAFLAFSGTVDPAGSRVTVSGARASVTRAGGRFTVRVSDVARNRVLRVRATSPGRRPSVEEVEVTLARSAIPDTREPQQAEPNRGPPGNADAAGGRVDIDTRDFAFTPSPVKAKVGQQIVWRNKDTADHALRPVRGPAGAALPRSGRLKRGDRYDLTILEPGRYVYACAIHPWMRGTIVARGE